MIKLTLSEEFWGTISISLSVMAAVIPTIRFDSIRQIEYLHTPIKDLKYC